MPDAINRVLIYYPALVPINAANFLIPGLLAPGMIAAHVQPGLCQPVRRPGDAEFHTAVAHYAERPSGDVQRFAGSACSTPIPIRSTSRCRSARPKAVPPTCRLWRPRRAVCWAIRPSLMNAADPGIFTQTGNGIGTAVAVNQDNTLNGPTNPAVQGSTITIYGTGQGFIAGAPPDGQISGQPLPTPVNPTVIMGFGPVPGANIQYSGLVAGTGWRVAAQYRDSRHGDHDAHQPYPTDPDSEQCAVGRRRESAAKYRST